MKNLDEYREVIITQLDDIFADARRKRRKGKKRKSQAKVQKNQVLTISKSVIIYKYTISFSQQLGYCHADLRTKNIPDRGVHEVANSSTK